MKKISYLQGADGYTGFTVSKNGGSDVRTYYYRKNIQGDITHIYDADGNVKAEYVYDAWGNHRIKEDPDEVGSLNPIRYRGYYFDGETGLYYLKTRYYDPQTGRFINADSIDIFDETGGDINGLNLYMYCGNNPVMNYDPTGKGFWGDLWNKATEAVGNFMNNAPDWVKITIGVVALVGAVALTVATGGALAPILIGFALSTAIGTVTGGVMAVHASGGDWSQFGKGAWGGFVDGVMFGGLFAFAGAGIGAINYTRNALGAVAGTKHLSTIAKGQHFDRFGGFGGRYITDVGTPVNMLALHPANTGIKTTLQATRNFRVYKGTIADAFGKTGGGTQYVMRYSIEKLLKKGWLVIV